MKPVCPDNDHLKALINQSFDEYFIANPATIEAIGQRLHPPRRNTSMPFHPAIRQWLFWLLIAITATATAAAFLLSPRSAPEQSNVNRPEQPTQPAADVPTASLPNNPPAPTQAAEPAEHDSRQGPVIYQREDY